MNANVKAQRFVRLPEVERVVYAYRINGFLTAFDSVDFLAWPRIL